MPSADTFTVLVKYNFVNMLPNEGNFKLRMLILNQYVIALEVVIDFC